MHSSNSILSVTGCQRKENSDGTTKYIDVAFVNKTMRGFLNNHKRLKFILYLYGPLYKLRNIVWLPI